MNSTKRAFLVAVIVISGCGPVQPPPNNEHSIPTGWVKIVNNSTGGVLHGDRDPVWIDPAGDCFKLRCKKSRQFLAIRDWAKNRDDATDAKGQPLRLLRQMPLSDNPSMLWEIKPVGDGFWSITNRASGKCLEFRGKDQPARQSLFRNGAPEQQWRFEPVPAADSTNTINDGASSRSIPETATSPQPPPMDATASKAGDSSHKEPLTAAQKEQIRLRLQSLYSALYSLPASVPLDQGPAVMQQEANLRAQISDLEAQLAAPSHPVAPGKSTWPSLVLWCLGIVALLAVAWRLRKGWGPGMALSFVRRSVARPAEACARGWSALDPFGKVFLVCVIAIVLLVSILPSVVLWGLTIAALSACAWRIRHWQELDRHARSVIIGGGVAAVLLLVFTYEGKPYISSIKDHDGLNEAVGLVVVGFEIRDGEKRIEIPFWSGSAFAVGPQSGIMLTNKHVVGEFYRLSSDTTWKRRAREELGVIATEKMWVFIAGEKYPASLLYTSPQFDFAMLKIPLAIKKTFRLKGSPTESLMDIEVRAIGFPGNAGVELSDEQESSRIATIRDASKRGENVDLKESFRSQGLQFVLTKGTICQLPFDEIKNTAWLQHTANIAPGSSGGPLVLADGVVVGINTIGVGNTEKIGSEFYRAISVGQLRTEIDRFIKDDNIWTP